MKKTSHDSVFARDEWLLNESTQMEYGSQFISDEVQSQSSTPRGVEESWIDLDHEKRKKSIMGLSRHFGVIEEDEDDFGAVEDSDEEDVAMIKRTRFNMSSPERAHFDLNTSLTTILAARRSAYDSDDEGEEDRQDQSLNGPTVTTEDSQVVFMDISNTSSVVSSTQLSVKRNKKRKMKRSDGSRIQTDLTQGIVLISIIASLSFSAGYALGQSRRHLY